MCLWAVRKMPSACLAKDVWSAQLCIWDANTVSVMQVMRGKKTAYEGTLSSLRRVKESVKEIDQGSECGVGCKGFIGWEEGDKIQAFELVSKRRTLEDIVAGPQQQQLLQQQMAAVQ